MNSFFADRSRVALFVSVCLLTAFVYNFVFYKPHLHHKMPTFNNQNNNNNNNNNNQNVNKNFNNKKNETTVVKEKNVFYVDDQKKILGSTKNTLQSNSTSRFIIVTTQRSGSGWLVALLDSHPSIYSSGELFAHQHDLHASWNSTRSTIEQFYAENRNKARLTGFKFMYNQGAHKYGREFAEYAANENIRIVHLVRRNALRRQISEEANTADKHNPDTVHYSHPTNTSQLKQLLLSKPVLDSRKVARRLRADVALVFDMHHVLAHTKHYYTIYYEDLRADPRFQLRLLQRFLGVLPANLTSNLLAIHGTTPVSQLLGNPEQVRTALLDTPYQYLFD